MGIFLILAIITFLIGFKSWRELSTLIMLCAIAFIISAVGGILTSTIIEETVPTQLVAIREDKLEPLYEDRIYINHSGEGIIYCDKTGLQVIEDAYIHYTDTDTPYLITYEHQYIGGWFMNFMFESLEPDVYEFHLNYNVLGGYEYDF